MKIPTFTAAWIAMHNAPNQRWLRGFSRWLLCLSAVACGSDTTGPPPQDLTTGYWALRLNHHAITMALTAPYNSVQLTAMSLTFGGTPVPGAGRVQYSTADTTVAVDSLGRVAARYPTFGQTAHVAASLTVQGITLTDTAYVQVDSFPLAHPVASFSIHPQGATCTKSAFDVGFSLPVYILDAVGDTLRNATGANVPVYYTSSDVTVATIDRTYGNVQGRGPAPVIFTATALIDGVVHQDTLSYVLGPRHEVAITADVQPGTGGAAPTLAFTPSAVTVGAGWHVGFWNPTSDTTDTVDVIFPDPRGQSGSVYNYYEDTAHIQPISHAGPGEVFFDAGTYAYHSDRFGSSGAITVRCDL